VESAAALCHLDRQRFGFSQTRKPGVLSASRQAAGKGKGHEPGRTLPEREAPNKTNRVTIV